MDGLTQSERKLYALSLIVAPLLLVISTFFWQGGNISIPAGTIQVYSFVFWIPALLGLLSLLRPSTPTLSVWGILLVCWVCIAGNNFGMDGIYRSSFMQAGADSAQLAAMDGAMRLASIFVLYLPGLTFPLTLFAIGFLLWRNQAAPALFALLLCLGAISFPISRIPRIELIAHLADFLLLFAAGGIGWFLWQGQTKPESMPRAIEAGHD